MKVVLMVVLCGLLPLSFAEVPGGAVPPSESPVLPSVLDLEAAEQLALAHNPLIRQFQARAEALAGDLRVTRAQGRPVFSAEADAGYDGNPNQRGDFGASDNESWRAGLRLNVPISSFGRLQTQLDAVEFRGEAATLQADHVRREVLRQLREAYLLARLREQIVHVQEASVKLLEAQWRENEARNEAGAITRLPVLQARVALENARTALLRAERDAEASRDRLRSVLGIPFSADAEDREGYRLSESWPVFPASALEFDVARERAREQRADFLALDAQIQAADASLVMARRSRSPSLGGFATAGVENDRFGDGDGAEEFWMLGLQFSWQFYDLGDRAGRVTRAEAELEEIRARRDEMLLALDADLRDALREHDLAVSVLERVSITEEQAEEALRLAREAHENGRATQLEVSNAELELTRARLEATTAVHDRLRALVRLQYVMGQ